MSLLESKTQNSFIDIDINNCENRFHNISMKEEKILQLYSCKWKKLETTTIINPFLTLSNIITYISTVFKNTNFIFINL